MKVAEGAERSGSKRVEVQARLKDFGASRKWSCAAGFAGASAGGSPIMDDGYDSIRVWIGPVGALVVDPDGDGCRSYGSRDIDYVRMEGAPQLQK